MKEVIGDVILHNDEHGEATDALLDELSFESDGDEQLRSQGGDHLRRAMIMNHPSIKQRRDDERSRNLVAKRQQMQERNEKYFEKVSLG